MGILGNAVSCCGLFPYKSYSTYCWHIYQVWTRVYLSVHGWILSPSLLEIFVRGRVVFWDNGEDLDLS